MRAPADLYGSNGYSVSREQRRGSTRSVMRRGQSVVRCRQAAAASRAREPTSGDTQASKWRSEALSWQTQPDVAATTAAMARSLLRSLHRRPFRRCFDLAVLTRALIMTLQPNAPRSSNVDSEPGT